MKAAIKTTLLLVGIFISTSAGAFFDCLKADPKVEYEQLLNDPKWKSIVEGLESKLQNNYARKCFEDKPETQATGLEIFADDVEFVGTEKRRMFEVLYKNYNPKDLRKKDEPLFTFEKKNNFLRVGAISIKIKTLVGSTIVLANACSAKEVLAYLAPTLDASLQSKCGSNMLVRTTATDKFIQSKADEALKASSSEARPAQPPERAHNAPAGSTGTP